MNMGIDMVEERTEIYIEFDINVIILF